MGAAADLIKQGFTGYQGWTDEAAAADFNATAGAGKGNYPTYSHSGVMTLPVTGFPPQTTAPAPFTTAPTTGSPAVNVPAGTTAGAVTNLPATTFGTAPSSFNLGSSYSPGERDENGVPPPFKFDYENEAKKAYGELGPYYLRLLSWAQGDMNKVLGRLTEDYDRGLRVKTEDTALGKSKIGEAQGQADIRQSQAQRAIQQNALARGLYQKSSNATPGELAESFSGFGIPDVNFNETNQNFNFQKKQRQDQKNELDTNLTRYKENADIQRSRQTTDTRDAESRKEFQMEEERKTRAGDISVTRGQRAYQDYVNKFSLS